MTANQKYYDTFREVVAPFVYLLDNLPREKKYILHIHTYIDNLFTSCFLQMFLNFSKNETTMGQGQFVTTGFQQIAHC